jgi:ATP-binding cassette subfamily F protein uup
LEKDIAALEKEKEQLVANLATGQGSRQDLITWPARLQAVDKELDAKGERWLELSDFV